MLTLKHCSNKASDTKKVYRIMMIANPSTTGSKFLENSLDGSEMGILGEI